MNKTTSTSFIATRIILFDDPDHFKLPSLGRSLIKNESPLIFLHQPIFEYEKHLPLFQNSSALPTRKFPLFRDWKRKELFRRGTEQFHPK